MVNMDKSKEELKSKVQHHSSKHGDSGSNKNADQDYYSSSLHRRYSVSDINQQQQYQPHHYHHGGANIGGSTTTSTIGSPNLFSTSGFRNRVTDNKIIKKLKVLEFVNEKREEFQNKIINEGSSTASTLIRTKDKFAFVLGVLNLCLIAYMSGAYPDWVPGLFTLEYVVLFIVRIFLYKRKKQHYFLFDFCYYANMLLLVYIHVAPQSETLFKICFCLNSGPLLGAVIPYRNSMVFHSLDKATSVLIHIFPSLVMYSTRWSSSFRFKDSDPYNGKWTSFFLYPVLFYVFWQAIYFYYVGNVKKETIKENNYITSLSFLSKLKEGRKPSVIARFLNAVTPSKRIQLFITSQFIYTCLTLLPCQLYYKSQIIHSIYIVGVLTICLWNGANFYIEYFSGHYVSQMKEREERWKKIIMSSLGPSNSAPNSPSLPSMKKEFPLATTQPYINSPISKRPDQ
ncbi:hypothetical protein CYY_003430 [Polysphondylium violaceum]|uniref:Glycerophosphocholine acyltransferase 1 n=1 Tax=Polysphondylium violaceum TaxID=133409 RepID=A0A8J4V8N8_9MYCE|nr:hypothetical protein CYY_003430 [Polysphondylium violaceum]